MRRVAVTTNFEFLPSLVDMGLSVIKISIKFKVRKAGISHISWAALKTISFCECDLYMSLKIIL